MIFDCRNGLVGGRSVLLTHVSLTSKLAQSCSHRDGQRVFKSSKQAQASCISPFQVFCLLSLLINMQLAKASHRMTLQVMWQGVLVTWRVCEFSMAVITDWVAETTEIYFFTLLESRNLRSMCQ